MLLPNYWSFDTRPVNWSLDQLIIDKSVRTDPLEHPLASNWPLLFLFFSYIENICQNKFKGAKYVSVYIVIKHFLLFQYTNNLASSWAGLLVLVRRDRSSPLGRGGTLEKSGTLIATALKILSSYHANIIIKYAENLSSFLWMITFLTKKWRP